MSFYLHFLDLLVIAFIIVMFRHTVLRAKFFLHIFQQHGYKNNEFRHWLFDHWNRRVLTAEHILFSVILFVLLIFLSDMVTSSAAIVILSIFGISWFWSFNYYGGEQAKKPLVFTARMIRLSVPFAIFALIIPLVSTVISYLGYIPFTRLVLNNDTLYSADIYILSFGWILGNALIPLFVIIASWITKPIEHFVHRHFIKLARAKLADMPDLKVIGITGSYGKTSTKFLIRDLLEERYSVCATPGSYNTPMGICKVINDDLDAHHQILVLEMGARYEGNISELCDIAEPDIAVVTNVGIAHLETFGSQDAIAQTKSTLVTRTKPNGKAVLNADDPRVLKMGDLRDDLEIITTGFENGRITATDVSYDNEGMHFTIHKDTEESQFSMSLLGSHNVQNMLLAVGVGSALGLRLKTMAVAAHKVEPVEHRMELKKQGTITVIDDAFNSNPVGAKNAVEVLSQFSSGRKIIITPGMIELGDLQDEKNREFGTHIGEAGLDLVILVGQKQTEAIKKGIASTNFSMKKVVIAESLFEANDIMQDFAREGDVVLYENDLPDSFDE